MNDTISRQQTITALRALSDEDGYINAPHEVVTDVVRGLPPVRAEHGQTTQPEQTKTDKLGVKAGKTYTDTISRKAAIDIIEDFPHGGVWNVESMEEMVYRIKQLPSAQPEQRWILCDMQLPEKTQLCLVTEKTVVGFEVCTRCFNKRGDGGFWSGWGHTDVIAWMPLPELYKGGTG